ncbi:MAG: hypothetical protein DRP51_05470, partial [Candidatus Zixiibacteriota bacterium]
MTTAAIKIGLFRQGKLTNQHRIGGENMGEAIFRFHAVGYMCLQIWRDHRDPALLNFAQCRKCRTFDLLKTIDKN